MQYLEDFTPGQIVELGQVTVDQDEVISFGRRFDPQPFHIDPDAAAETSFGGLIASAWHVGAMFMRLYVEGVLNNTATLGGSGMDKMRMLHPVRPGDTLTATVEMLEVRQSTYKPDRGTVTAEARLVNRDGVSVLTCELSTRVVARPQSTAAL